MVRQARKPAQKVLHWFRQLISRTDRDSSWRRWVLCLFAWDLQINCSAVPVEIEINNRALSVQIALLWISHLNNQNESTDNLLCFAYLNMSCHADGFELCAFVNESLPWVNAACHSCEWVMSHLSMSFVRQIALSYFLLWMSHCVESEWVLSQLWMSHVTLVNESRRADGFESFPFVNKSLWMRHVIVVNESCYTCKWVTSCR